MLQPSSTSSFGRYQGGKLSAFVTVPLIGIALLVAVYWLFADSLIKWQAQQQLSKAWGAEVNIAEVQHHLFPLAIEINGIQVTDNAQPTRNLVAVKKASAQLEFWPLLSSKVIADSLVLDEVAMDTPRSSAGEVTRLPDPNSAFKWPSKEDIPSVDELLANSPLKTIKAVEQANTTLSKHKTNLQTQYASLPNKEKLEDYKTRVKALQQTNYKDPQALLAAKQEFEVLKQAILQDREAFKRFSESAKVAKQDIQASVSELKQAPTQDYALLKGVIAGDEAAIGQISQQLFGDKAQMMTKTLLMVMQMVNAPADNTPAPIDNSGIPNIWIKDAQIGLLWQQKSIQSQWKNITDQHLLINSPTSFLVNAGNADLWQALDIKGQFEILQGKVNAEQSWDIKGLALQAVELIPQDAKQKLSALLQSGLLNAVGQLRINDGALEGASVFNLRELKMQAKGSNDLSNTMASLISQLQNIALNTTFAGNLASPKVSISSDLDNNMLKALGSHIKDSDEGKLGELKAKLNAKASKALGASNEQLDSVSTLIDLAQGNTQVLNELADAQLDSLIEKQKEKLLNKLSDKLFKKG